MKSRRKTKDVDWGAYPTIVAAATACRKFDDMLRMVIAGNTQQRQQLTDYLDQKYQIGQLTYGLHVSDRAVLTCLVFERNGRQVHFVDGADGGYSVFHLDEVQYNPVTVDVLALPCTPHT